MTGGASLRGQALTPRLGARVERDFAATDRAEARRVLEHVDLGDWKSTTSPAGRERVQAAILVLAAGDPARLARAVALAERDWRDALMAGELAQPDWPERLEAFLAPAPLGNAGSAG